MYITCCLPLKVIEWRYKPCTNIRACIHGHGGDSKEWIYTKVQCKPVKFFGNWSTFKIIEIEISVITTYSGDYLSVKKAWYELVPSARLQNQERKNHPPSQWSQYNHPNPSCTFRVIGKSELDLSFHNDTRIDLNLWSNCTTRTPL